MQQLVRNGGFVIRGALMGIAEIIPGVSGGTIALIVGVYNTLIAAAAHAVRAVTLLFHPGGRVDIPGELRAIRWRVVIPVLVGMFSGIFVGAALVEPIVSAYPVETRAVFAGLILASLWVPIRMVAGGWTLPLLVLALGAAAASFVVSGLPALVSVSSSLWWVAPAAALAVCALVLPGVSGSFLLVTLGVYEQTLSAVNNRDVGYLAIFIAGAIVGLGLFVRVLQRLLEHHRVVTLVVMTGLMAGSLRALWPWQGEGRELLAVPEGSSGVFALILAGVGVVAAVVLVERLSQSRVNPGSVG